VRLHRRPFFVTLRECKETIRVSTASLRIHRNKKTEQQMNVEYRTEEVWCEMFSNELEDIANLNFCGSIDRHSSVLRFALIMFLFGRLFPFLQFLVPLLQFFRHRRPYLVTLGIHRGDRGYAEGNAILLFANTWRLVYVSIERCVR
jgi:hypothetical protein